MTLARLLRESPCFMTIQPSLRARWTKPRWHFAKRVTPRKQTASRASYANVIRITSADEQRRTAWAAVHYSLSRYSFGTDAMPQGPSPTLMRRSSLRDFTSTTETSFDAPFAVSRFDPVGSSAIPQARLPTG